MRNTILLEIDKNLELDFLLNYESGLWFLNLTPIFTEFKDSYGNTLYYKYNNKIVYMVKSCYVDGVIISSVENLADCRTVENSFYYDQSSTKIIFHFENFDPPLDKIIQLGITVGYSYNGNTFYFDNRYYDPRIEKVFPIKKSIDQSFFGLLKYQSGNIDFRNEDGYFDNWNDEKNYGNAARYLIGSGNIYGSYVQKYSGYIEDFSCDWDSFNVNIQDVRKSLTQPISKNNYSSYQYIHEDNKTVNVPVAYGTIRNANCICVNETFATSNYIFSICDTTYNAMASIDKVYVDGVEKTALNKSLANGTFELSVSDVGGNFELVTCYFVATTLANGVDIIKDLMYRYDDKNYIASFWDTAEVDAAQAISRTTSLYVKDSAMKLSECIESVCNDCDLRFFVKDNGKYTIRVYDKDRLSTATILYDEWISSPQLKNNSNEFLSSVIIKYSHNIASGDFKTYENKDYETLAYAKYRSLKPKTYETSIDTEANAILKSQTIMLNSSDIRSVVSRSTSLEKDDIEVTDFITCDPWARNGLTETLKVYEVISIEKDYSNNTRKLSLKYVRD